MSDTKFTAGQWEVFTSSYPGMRHGIECDGFSVIIFGDTDDPRDEAGIHGETMDEAHANARLIAASPEMFALLERLNEAINGDDYDEDYIDHISIAANEWIALRSRIVEGTK